MKKINLLLFAFCLAVATYSQNWIEFTTAETTEPVYDLTNSDSLLVKFNILIPGMYNTEIDTFNRVEIKEHTKLDSVGYPEIPIVSFLVAIPDCERDKYFY